MRNFLAQYVFLVPTAMSTPNDPQKNLVNQELDLSQDKELWELLGQNSVDEASPLFSRNVLRKSVSKKAKLSLHPHFGANCSPPRYLVPGALAALALTVALVWSPSDNAGNPLCRVTRLPMPSPSLLPLPLRTSLESELLLAAADTPSLFSDEEVIAMLF